MTTPTEVSTKAAEVMRESEPALRRRKPPPLLQAVTAAESAVVSV